ncbi:MAG: DUF1178 family protein [Thioalkalispiraceae bacterium]|jgi:hypothetical protein
MIVFDLICEHEHQFEGWFKDASDFVSQQNTGLLTCPTCGTDNIVKIPSASHINTGKKDKQLTELANIQHDAAMLVNKITEFVTNNYENVGDEFAAVTKKIHYGLEAERNIYGSATLDEALELQEEGIDIIPLPGPNKKDKLN